ncbi:AT-rich interactive domain-containing protein 5-like [Oryza brachyantha]|uniref:ARID domain-containing protein n=1 Tax=Oryza brachyantha TaxID=4533 RepID=J3MFY1_ORYBR|nr:AT-rich interactive domain-containing protein 5-like [Oryza brachyantha]
MAQFRSAPQESEGEPGADVPVDEAKAVEEEKSGKGEDGLEEAADAVDSVKDSAKHKGMDAEEELVEQEGEAAAHDSKDIPVTNGKRDAGGNEVAEMEVEKLENGDGHAKADGEKGRALEVEGGSDGDKKGGDGEKQLTLASAGEDVEDPVLSKLASNSFMFDYSRGGDDSGTEEEQAAFMKELERFYREKLMEFKPPKFYGEGLNCLKLWRQVTGLGGYEQVTSCKLWRQVGESFKPPKTCTTVSWTFRNFYEKALLEYEKHKIETGEFQVAASTLTERIASESQVGGINASSSGRARRESATRAMQGWHSQRLLGNGEIADPIIKDKGTVSVLKKDKTPKSSGSAKRKRTPTLEDDRVVPYKSDKLQNDSMVLDLGPPADWVKINVRRTKDCYEVYALVPGLLREEVHVQSDPAGRLIVTGEPEQLDNPWGVTPFKKVISLPSRIDPHQTSAVVTLHGQLFVRAPFEQSK